MNGLSAPTAESAGRISSSRQYMEARNRGEQTAAMIARCNSK